MTTPRTVLQLTGDREAINAAVKAMNAGGMAADVLNGDAFAVDGGAYVGVEFPRAQSRQFVDHRVVVAPDGTKIEVRRKWPDDPASGWRAYWRVGRETYFAPWVDISPYRKAATCWNRSPTDAEVLADYEAWKAGQK